MTKIVSYNVNGIRAAITKGFMHWLKACNPDIICLQEIKANLDQLDAAAFEALGYYHYWYPAQKKGYSGVAILSKVKPNHVEYGCGIEAYDCEGRMLRADFNGYSVMSLYLPSGTTGDIRQQFKYQFLADFERYIQSLQQQYGNLIISGDYNICHQPIDIHNPVSNAKSSGFLPEERDWMGRFLNTGFVDTFRHFNLEPHNYTWWSYRAGSRGKNLGWRIDYHLATNTLRDKLRRALILPDAIHSDHCPIVLEID